MNIEGTFQRLIDEYGRGLLYDHLIHLWWYVKIENEDRIIELIENLANEYDDPSAAEVGFIAIWQNMRG